MALNPKLLVSLEKWGILTQRYTQGGHPLKKKAGASLAVQWPRLHALNAWWLGSIPGQGIRSHMVQWRVSILQLKKRYWGLPFWFSGKESTCQCRRRRFDPWWGKISPCHRATKPLHHNYWACAPEPPTPQLLKPTHPRACAVQQEKPPQWEVHAAVKTQQNHR